VAKRLRTSLVKRAERLAQYGTDADRSTYALRGVDKPLGKRRVKKHDTPRSPHCEHDPRAECDETAPARQERVFTGKSVPVANKLSRLETGELGEHIVMAYLKTRGEVARRLSVEEAQNFPVDVMVDHEVIEVKAGLVSNGPSAHHWRATAGQPGVKETEWLKTASPEEKAEWNHAKGKAAIARKRQALRELSEKHGVDLKGKTYALILNPDTRQADLFAIDDFHERIGWTSDLARHSFVGTVRY